MASQWTNPSVGLALSSRERQRAMRSVSSSSSDAGKLESSLVSVIQSMSDSLPDSFPAMAEGREEKGQEMAV